MHAFKIIRRIDQWQLSLFSIYRDTSSIATSSPIWLHYLMGFCPLDLLLTRSLLLPLDLPDNMPLLSCWDQDTRYVVRKLGARDRQVCTLYR